MLEDHKRERGGRERERMPTGNTRTHLQLCCLSIFKRPGASTSQKYSHNSNNNTNHVPSSSSSSSTVVFTNFNSLYYYYDASATTDFSDSTTMSTRSDLSTAIATRRLTLPSPGRSNSIVDSTAIDVGIGLAVPTLSLDPYAEFRSSMEEMISAMELLDGSEERHHHHHVVERLYDLFIFYLAFNKKNVHHYIRLAFRDLVAGLQIKLS